MVFIPSSKFHLAYEWIKKDHEEVSRTQGPAGTVAIFVAPDCDALCACKILTVCFRRRRRSAAQLGKARNLVERQEQVYTMASKTLTVSLNLFIFFPPKKKKKSLLKLDFITYTVKPVRGYEHLRSAAQELVAGNDGVRSLVLINCGGAVDLLKFFNLGAESQITVYVADSHRPYHLNNVHDDSGHVYLLGAEDDDDDDGGGESARGVVPPPLPLSGDDEAQDDDERNGTDENDDDPAYRAEVRRRRMMQRQQEEDEADDELLRYLSDSDGDNVSDDDDDDDDDDDEKSSGGDDDDESDLSDFVVSDNEEEDEDVEKDASRKRARREPTAKRRRLSRQERRRRRKKLRRLAERRSKLIVPLHRHNRDYYSGSYFSTAAADIMYQLAYQRSNDSNDLLWLAVLGMTDQYLHDSIGQHAYTKRFDRFRSEVARFNLIAGEEGHTLYDNDGAAKSVDCEEGRIKPLRDFKFMLYRHWNLYDSMYHSRYVATRLGIWRRAGRQALDTLLALMGFPKSQATQKFSLMRSELKRELEPALSSWGAQFELPDVQFSTFMRQINFKLRLTAADAVYAVSALLELGDFHLSSNSSSSSSRSSSSNQSSSGESSSSSSSSLLSAALAASSAKRRRNQTQRQQQQQHRRRSARFGGDDNDNDQNENGSGDDESDDHALDGDDERELQKIWEENFWTAYDALSATDIDDMRRGLQLAVELQRAIVRQGAALLEKKMVTSGASFRYCFLSDRDTQLHSDLAFFSHPRALTKLSAFIVDTLHAGRREPKPFVICVINDELDRCIVAGNTPYAVSPSSRNHFGQCFQRAALLTNARIKLHSFDTSVIELDRPHIRHFMDTLHSLVVEQ
jgi:cell division control protein 45